VHPADATVGDGREPLGGKASAKKVETVEEQEETIDIAEDSYGISKNLHVVEFDAEIKTRRARLLSDGSTSVREGVMWKRCHAWPMAREKGTNQPPPCGGDLVQQCGQHGQPGSEDVVGDAAIGWQAPRAGVNRRGNAMLGEQCAYPLDADLVESTDRHFYRVKPRGGRRLDVPSERDGESERAWID
jgi:hypothetical protein